MATFNEETEKSKQKVDYGDKLYLYLQDIKPFKPLSKDETTKLFERYHQGDQKAYDILLKHNLRLVTSMAKRYRNLGVDYSDLISEGNIGLMQAIKKYDYQYKGGNIPFQAYARLWIKSGFFRMLTNQTDYTNGTSPNKIDDYCDIVYNTRDTINEDYERKIDDLEQRRASLNELMECLKERERKILRLYYGLETGEEMTLEEVSRNVGLSTERTRQIRDKCIRQLRHVALGGDDSMFDELKSM